MNGLGEQPAFPSSFTGRVDEYRAIHEGLTKRELLAAITLHGWACGRNLNTNMFDESRPDRVADAAVKYADALLARLEAK